MNERNNKILFWASFLTLVAAGMGFAIRNDIITAWGREFGFTQTELGSITGMGLFGFGITIIVFSFFADAIGYGKLMIVAFLLHFLAAIGTLAAPWVFQMGGKDAAYWCLFLSALAFSLANGTCEAVINPLTATLFPNNKTHWLNILHAGWPGGLVLGALTGLLFNQIGIAGWQIKWAIVLAPMIIYGLMMVGRPFPRSEAHEAGLSTGVMIGTLLSGILLFLFLLHALVGYVELGVDTWIIDITKIVLDNPDAALILFIWTNVLMFTLRFFAGPIVHKISPLGLLLGSAILGTLGLWLLGLPAVSTLWVWLGAVTVYGIGKTFYWPTLLGVISERFPKGGAIVLGISGGIGMISAGLLGAPLIGYKQDYAAINYLQEQAPETYARYKAPDTTAPVPVVEPIAGLDNGKVGVLVEFRENQAKIREAMETNNELTEGEKARLREALENNEALGESELALVNKGKGEGEKLTEAAITLTMDKDLEKLRKEGDTDNEQLQILEKQSTWWETEGKPNLKEDYPWIQKARSVGGKQALAWTAAVPAALAIGFLLLVIYFKATGGYKAEVLAGHEAEDEKFTGGTEGPGEG